MGKSALAAAAALVVLGSAGEVAAQCAPGRVVTDATAGRCCWPGQTWDDERARCDGPPACPSGWGATGDECVRVESAPAQPSAATSHPAAPRPAPIPIAATSDGHHYVGFRTVRRPVRGLWLTGVVLLSLAYTYNIVVGAVWLNSSSCDAQSSWANWIPIAGGFVWAGVADGCGYGSSLGLWMGTPGSAVQTLGLILLTIGLLTRQSAQVPDDGPRLTSGPGDVGLALAWDLD